MYKRQALNESKAVRQASSYVVSVTVQIIIMSNKLLIFNRSDETNLPIMVQIQGRKSTPHPENKKEEERNEERTRRRKENGCEGELKEILNSSALDKCPRPHLT